MIAKTNTERGQALRDRRKAEGLEEVRGIWAPPPEHQPIKDYAAKLAKKRGKGKK